jgi:eukaryotic-like serine/threonine-protein kinase
MRALTDAFSDTVRRRPFPNVTTVREEGREAFREEQGHLPPASLPGRYQYIGPIGSGGMGSVCSVRDLDLLRCVAMKVLGPEPARNDELVQRFVREAQITAELDHPNIVPVYERGQDRHGNHYFTMKRVDGRTLAQWIEEVGRPTRTGEVLQKMLVTVAKVCDGLAFAHSRGVLHCDVKPENIMVGSFGQVYLMDWGVACLLDERPVAAWLPTQIPAREDPATRLFRGGGGLNGTPAFMSPEQAFGYTHLVDERTDVFGLGAVLYTILLGRPPFGGSQINAVISQARACSIIFNGCDASAPLPLELCRITARAMARDPAHRYQTVLDLQRALQAVVAAELPPRDETVRLLADLKKQ